MDNLEGNSPKPLAGQGASDYQEKNRFLLLYLPYIKDVAIGLSYVGKAFMDGLQ